MEHIWEPYLGEDMDDVRTTHDIWECIGCGIKAAYKIEDSYSQEQVRQRLSNLECSGVKGV